MPGLPGLFGPFCKATTVAAQRWHCKQYPGKIADGYPKSYDVMSHLMLCLFANGTPLVVQWHMLIPTEWYAACV